MFSIFPPAKRRLIDAARLQLFYEKHRWSVYARFYAADANAKHAMALPAARLIVSMTIPCCSTAYDVFAATTCLRQGETVGRASSDSGLPGDVAVMRSMLGILASRMNAHRLAWVSSHRPRETIKL